MAFNKEAKFSEKNWPEPPKDENGNPIAPPEGFKPPKGFCPPEPPKDENGNPIAPPEGFKPPKPGCCCGEKPAEEESV